MSNALQVQQPQTPGNYSGSDNVYRTPDAAYQNEGPVSPDQLTSSVEFNPTYLANVIGDSADPRTTFLDVGRAVVSTEKPSDNIEDPSVVARKASDRGRTILGFRHLETRKDLGGK